MDLKILMESGRTVEISDAAEIQIADGPIAPDFIKRKIEDTISPDGVPITITPKAEDDTIPN
jgi:hypothetical protein